MHKFLIHNEGDDVGVAVHLSVRDREVHRHER